MAKALFPLEAVIGADGVAEADGETLTEEVPTETAVVVGTTAGAEVVTTVPLVYTGAEDGATTAEVVTGLTTVQGQLVMVKVVEAVAV